MEELKKLREDILLLKNMEDLDEFSFRKLKKNEINK